MRRQIAILAAVMILALVLPLTGQHSLAAASLKVQYQATNTNATDGEIVPWFRIVNTGTTSVALSELKLRYWYTVDGDTAQSAPCDWAQAGCANLTRSLVKLASPVTGADYYLEVGFTSAAGSLAAGSYSEIQMRIHKNDWAAYNESDDYSFDPTKTAFADWSKVTLYHNGTLVWGSAPGGSSPSNTPTPTATSTPTPTTGAATSTPTPTATPTPTSTDSYPAWEPDVAYAVGALVSYEGSVYKCIQAHTSQVGWEPPNTPALWELQSGTAPTPTSSPTATPTATPTEAAPTPTPTPGTAPTPTPTPDNTTPPAGRIIGYFVQWGVYGRSYYVKNVHTSGSASKLTHINYAFSNIDASLKCASGDSYADYDMFYGADLSVDGVADTWDTGALRGNFNQLRKLKAMYPHLKIMISIGGWTWSDKFSDAALPANRAAFVASCIDMFIKGNFAPGLSYPGIFDGIDIDWEYPGACGNTCNFRPEDTQNFTALLAEFRSQLNTLSTQTGKQYLLTIAAPAGQDKISKIEVGKIHQYLDFINLMTYDFHGAWESRTNFHSALYGSPADPDYGLGFWTDNAVQLWLNGGTPAGKLVVGVPFYGRGWQGVPPGPNGDGLYQTGSGAAPGTYEAGIEDYKVLKGLEASYSKYRHPQTQAFYIYNGNIWWSYDDPTSMTNKANYIKTKANGLGGAMFWELSGDDSGGSLITALYNTLK